MSPWAYPGNRYYYEWYEQEPPSERSDMEIKQDLLDRLRTGPYEQQLDIDVDVKKGVVILTGKALTPLTKRATGDDAWDTAGVTDVSNQILVDRAAALTPQASATQKAGLPRSPAISLRTVRLSRPGPRR